MVTKSYLGSSVGSKDGVVKLAQLICTQDNMWAMYDIIPFLSFCYSTCPYSRPPFGYGNFPSSMPECLGYYEDRYQTHEAMFSALNRDYPFRDYPDERAHNDDSRSCENMDGTSYYNSHCHSGEEYLNPMPQLDIGALENVFTAPTSTPSSIQQVNVTDSDEEEEEKVLRNL